MNYFTQPHKSQDQDLLMNNSFLTFVYISKKYQTKRCIYIWIKNIKRGKYQH